MTKLFPILKHEFKSAVANKTFVIMTLIGPFLIAAMTVLPSLLMSKASKSNSLPIFVMDSAPYAERFVAAMNKAGRSVRLVNDFDSAARDVGKDAARGLFAEKDGEMVLYARNQTDIELIESGRAVFASIRRSEILNAAGVDPAIIQSSALVPSLNVIQLDSLGKAKTDKASDFLTTLFTVLGFLLMLYITVMLYGQMIGRSVVTEKTSKTVETMLSSVSPSELMYGKIFGLGLAGILQYGVWISMALLLTKLAGPIFNMNLSASISIANLAWLLIYFILGFFLYSTAYAAIGATSEDEQQMGQMAWPLHMFLMVPFMMFSPLMAAPQSVFTIVLSFFPLTSPIVMLLRIIVATPPLWQIALSLLLLAAGIWAMFAASARIFRIGILMTGKRVTFKEVGRWLFVK